MEIYSVYERVPGTNPVTYTRVELLRDLSANKIKLLNQYAALPRARTQYSVRDTKSHRARKKAWLTLNLEHSQNQPSRVLLGYIA